MAGNASTDVVFLVNTAVKRLENTLCLLILNSERSQKNV